MISRKKIAKLLESVRDPQSEELTEIFARATKAVKDNNLGEIAILTGIVQKSKMSAAEKTRAMEAIKTADLKLLRKTKERFGQIGPAKSRRSYE